MRCLVCNMAACASTDCSATERHAAAHRIWANMRDMIVREAGQFSGIEHLRHRLTPKSLPDRTV
jgi:hypothetical protein